MAAPAAIWRVHRRPHRRLIIVAVILGLAFAAGGAWLLHALMIEPDVRIAVIAGLAVGGGIIAITLGGAQAWVGEDRVLRYGFGSRIDLEVPLAATREWRVLSGGLFHGIGCTVPMDAVTFHTRKAGSPGRMADWRRDLGVDLILEHLTGEDAQALEALARGE